MSDSFREQLQAALSSAYALDREITGGGMSRVYVATERHLGRTVVVKVLRPDLAAGVNRERFRREIMLAAQLQHPHIVPLLSAGEHGELLWYTMPFVEGESLREALARGHRFTPREVTRVLHDVLDALAYAHGRGVIHRDIKPGNILRHGSHSLVTDFGVAKALSASMPHSGTTSVGVAIGTPAYMAPEQLAADPRSDHRMDLYAVGLLAYELLTGEQPFGGLSPQATMAAQLTRMPEPLEQRAPGVPGLLGALVMKLLDKQPENRPATAAAALEELEATMTPQSGVTAPTPTWPMAAEPPTPVPGPAANATTPAAPGRSQGRRVGALAAAGIVLAAAGVYAGSLLMDRRRGEDSARVKSGPGDTVAVARPPVPPQQPATPTVAPDSRAVAPPTPSGSTAARVPGDTTPTGRDGVPGPASKTTGVAGAAGAAGAKNPAGSTATPPAPRVAPAGAGGTGGGAAARRDTSGGRTAPVAAERPRPAAGTPPRRTTVARPDPAKRNRRVALLPVRDATARPDLAPVARALEDSLRRALTGAGYTLASDAELVRLLAENDMSAQRRTAESVGIGAVVTGVIGVRGEELIAQAQIHDIWRSQALTERDESELDDPNGALAVVRDVMRALDRVSWRQRTDPRRVVIFDFDNQTGREEMAATTRAITDSMRSAARRLGLEVVTDSLVLATTGTNERRLIADQRGVGAMVAGSISRRSGDSVSVRFSVRDMSEERTFPTVELRAPLETAMAELPQRLTAEIGKVNWGPKGMQAPPGKAP